MAYYTKNISLSLVERIRQSVVKQQSIVPSDSLVQSEPSKLTIVLCSRTVRLYASGSARSILGSESESGETRCFKCSAVHVGSVHFKSTVEDQKYSGAAYKFGERSPLGCSLRRLIAVQNCEIHPTVALVELRSLTLIDLNYTYLCVLTITQS
ncbi:hypothetical protein AVEN_155127-1 [Araneus ventricosus]|uniref:Uncharacterized protein n=1 Tax=Araneus ventricosus TaxID=182803 RepID=A0A4Y2MDD8_ARAVE|nr:hypothetical protein AVEN_147690-1 [Araneus ventricosus]GBN76530.1 hypothetical protein AVEN_155127-1 [Araneus ventricosus]